MTWLRVFHAEILKIKRTIALKMVLAFPTVVVLLILFLVSQAPFSTLEREGMNDLWTELARVNLKIWALLMLPLYMTLESVLVAGLDHSENQWKALLARPVPRWTLYATKLVIVLAMVAAATLVLLLGVLLSGAILPRLQPEVVFRPPVPWLAMLRDGALVVALLFLALTIQQWVSLRWRSFSVAVGFGIVASVLGFFATTARHIDSWPQYFPWALPMLIPDKRLEHIEAVLVASCLMGLVAAAAGCWDFCRRDVT